MRIHAVFVGVCLACNSTPRSMGPELGVTKAQLQGKRGKTHNTDEAPTPPDYALKVGETAPSVELALQNGTRLRLDDLRGQNVVLFFYPMDDTPGCRAEARGFRDHFAGFQRERSVVLGVSLQDALSHQKFIAKEQLPFDLVVDTRAEISTAFGVPINGNVAARQTFLLDTDGVVARVWRTVSPETHAAEVLTTLTERGASSPPSPN